MIFRQEKLLTGIGSDLYAGALLVLVESQSYLIGFSLGGKWWLAPL